MKNECPYILEFISYYRVIGFSKALIVTNDNDDRSIELLSLLKSAGFVDVIEHTVPPSAVPQRKGFRLAMRQIEKMEKNLYVHVADADEFLVLHDDTTIQAYLSRFSEPDAISFNWKFFGSNGHVTRPDGLVIENYARRAADDFREHYTLKSMWRRTDKLAGFSAHFPGFHDVKAARCLYSDGVDLNAELFTSKPHQDWSRRTFDLASIHHYGIKSWDEFQKKRVRGRGANSVAGGGTRHTDEYFQKFDNNDVVDPIPSDLIENVRTEMNRIFEVANLGSLFERSYLGLHATDG